MKDQHKAHQNEEGNNLIRLNREDSSRLAKKLLSDTKPSDRLKKAAANYLRIRPDP